jgi:hypothetical protein
MVLTRSIALVVVACACAPLSSVVPDASLDGTDGVAHAIYGERATVLVFFSSHCPCMRAHDERLVALARDYAPRGLRFFAVDSEVGATREDDAELARERAYPFPILIDHDARIARAAGAEYATYSIVLDARGDVLYRGGFDSDHTHLSNGATPYLRDALDDVVAGRAVRHARTEPLGCALRTW